MRKHITTIFISLFFCILLGSVANASTMIFFDNSSCPSDSFMKAIAGVQFDILGDVEASSFKHNFPAGWLFMPTGSTVSAFDGGGNNSLATGLLGTFDNNVILRNWALSDQAGKSYQIPDFSVTSKLVGTDFHYQITAPSCAVPIPGAVWLLGSGLIGLAGYARKKRS